MELVLGIWGFSTASASRWLNIGPTMSEWHWDPTAAAALHGWCVSGLYCGCACCIFASAQTSASRPPLHFGDQHVDTVFSRTDLLQPPPRC